MKKKYIVAIIIPSICLVFGSLVYCAISAFPELLLSEEEKQERLKQAEEEERFFLGDTNDFHNDYYLFNDESKDEEKPVEVGFVFESSPVEVAPELYDEVEFIMVDAHEAPVFEIETNDEPTTFVENIDTTSLQVNEVIISNENTLSIISDEKIATVEEISDDSFIAADDLFIEETNEALDVVEMNNHVKSGLSAALPVAISENEIVEETEVLERKEKKIVEQETTIHNEVLECTLLVIGFVDILSFFLIRKRKRLSRY